MKPPYVVDAISVIMLLAVLEERECVHAPSELKVYVKGHSALVHWVQEGDVNEISRFELTCEFLGATVGTFRITHGINRVQRSFRLWGLLPSQRYRVYMVTITELGASNTSEVVDFATNLTDTFEYVQVRSKGIQLEEALILFVVVGLWVCAMVLFVKQWDNIRILQPQETRYKHAPKNLETIKVVKKAQDSVIYKNYSRKMSLTMVEREKKLLRMNTVPIMENVASLQTINSFKKLSTIEMEEGIQEEVDTAGVSSNV
ncbi:uncharacterized protein LOC123527258 [Mercenaria mercenaria]|uniref:uncharacterized protein LOC123527258 n=1 Tax=Mercenaria mercenaria TaxID=6596 RepID=UPI00234E6F18|nr:uncharacterized protein LOC123527258 [Mercenaria mercenaria]